MKSPNIDNSIDTSIGEPTEATEQAQIDLESLPKISDKHRRFVHDYIYEYGFNGAEAIRNNPSYNTQRPSETACRLLKNDKIAKHIEYHKQLMTRSMMLNEQDILKGLGDFALNGEKEANRIRCYEALAKIKGLMKPDTQVQVANVFTDVDSLRDNILNRHK